MGGTESVPGGWRVLAVDPRGPCGQHNIIPFFEYIVAINGKRLDEQGKKVLKSLAMSKQKRTELTLLNYKTTVERTLEIFPSISWGGAGLLGLIIVQDDWATADRRAVKVLSVKSGSPAEKACFEPSLDYILGTESVVFPGWGGFLKHLERHKDSELRLRVYNARTSELREVRVKCTDADSYGFQLGAGELHQIPDILPGTEIRGASSLAVEISAGSAGILTSPMMKESANKSGEPISTSDMYLAIGDPISSLYDEKTEK